MENTVETTESLIQSALEKGMDYTAYRTMVTQLATDKATTGKDQTEALIQYTQLNDRRMNRWDKTLKIPSEFEAQLQKLDKDITFLVLTESWCGDASPSLPVMNKLAQLSHKIDFKIILRDQHEALMDLFLTNGARSIPKLLMLDTATHEVLGEWGPRPGLAAKMVKEYKEIHGKLTAEFRQELQVWYNKDKGQAILEELVALLPLK